MSKKPTTRIVASLSMGVGLPRLRSAAVGFDEVSSLLRKAKLERILMKTAYVILGMHRSGTSSVAGSLALLGAEPPASLMGPKPDNPAGFWESVKISDFNDEIFHSVGSTWHDWGPLKPDVFSGPHQKHFHSAARWLIQSEFSGAATIVLKDPRICRLYPFWREALRDLGYAPIVVSPIRAPREVAASLVARNELPTTLALRLWLSHVLEAEWTSRGQARHVMLWADFMANWREHVREIMTLGGAALLPSAAEPKIDVFLDANLHRQKADMLDAHLPALVSRTMDAMIQLARTSEPIATYRTLDRIRRDFAVAQELFYDEPR